MAEGEVIEIAECSDQTDSDCEIQEVDVPVINVSEDEVYVKSEGSQSLSCPPAEEDKSSLLTISFKSREDFEHLKECISSAIQKCLELKGVYTQSTEKDSLTVCFIKTEAPPKKEEEAAQADDVTDMFLIDTTPTEQIAIGAIPSYKRAIKDVMDNEAKKPKLSDDHCARPKTAQSCFNCFGNHSLRDCPEPRNQSRINKARKQFMESKSDQRYHIDIEQRFAHIKPGKLSDKIRKALGLGRREIPSFFYKMRVLGYPPGWLEDAKVAHSGIALFDSEGREVNLSDEEDGEVDVERHKYDPAKIISFPGFNTHPGPEYFDEFKYHGVPRMHPKLLKEEFIKSLGDNIVKGYKRKKLKNLSATVVPSEDRGVITDMDVEDVVEDNIQCLPPLPPPLPGETPPPLPHIAPTPERKSIPNVKERGSPTLEDLVAKHKQLQEALESVSRNTSLQDDSLVDKVLELERQIDENINETGDPNSTTGVSASSKDCSSPKTPNLQTNRKASIPGTPILKFSPYDKLPEGENFKKGVSDVLFFENLPEYTGKYEKMKNVIKKVRTMVTKLNSEN